MADRGKHVPKDDKEKTGALPVAPKAQAPSSNPDYQTFPTNPGNKSASGAVKGDQK